jgi:hypothetical protein
MNRKERRAAAHKDRKLARKAGFPSPTPAPASEPPVVVPIPETPKPVTPISDAQLTANRANAQLSTGPKTESGRAISSQNRTTHGLARHNGTFVLLAAENPNGFEALKASLVAEHEPTTETESILINGMAESHWLAHRAQTTHTRAFHKCLNDLVKLRSERRKTETGFEAQERKKEELRLQNERNERKKEHHYWDILLKDATFCHRAGQNVANINKAMREDPAFEARYHAEMDRLLENNRPAAREAVAQAAAA